MDKKQNNAKEVFKQAFDRYYSGVYRFCLSRLPNDSASAEDCTQEAFVVLYKKYCDGEKIENTYAFLLQTARYYILKQLRQLEKQQDVVNINEVIHIPSQSEDIDDRLTFEQYSREISAALSDREAETFKLRYIDELTADAIADIQNRNISAVYTELSRIRQKLRKIFPRDYFSS